MEILIKACLEVFGGSNGANQSMNACTKEQVLRDDLKHEFQWRYFDASASAAQIVKWVTDLLPDTSAFPGELPAGVHDNIAGCYRDWLRDNAG